MLSKILPGKSMIIPGLIVSFLALFIYNKVPQVAKILGNPSKGA